MIMQIDTTNGKLRGYVGGEINYIARRITEIQRRMCEIRQLLQVDG